ncbi:ribose-phosphate pyrophosphokinase [Gregarina niphandrodes]|uniref:ribose-phosphate diphosphokinase n=1 Tax=Gregarina niphandrodes TaxID=110365 RepID=A0A023B397_GRENI|nr:ribose-phosphate pyrophosphokinase [Gregarina niphandrodes]EZG55171.1 ribose-phosphate pyrophosphokinase [Gregarina niphandrodes]|eukprot:XP_011131740.1 ribose-phosphate pyrophosphokinase [Gregarina niphandrodes]
MGVHRVLFVDHHDPRAAAFFPESIPVINVLPHRLAVRYFKNKKLDRPVVVSPDNECGERAKAFWSRFKTGNCDVGMAAIVTDHSASVALDQCVSSDSSASGDLKSEDPWCSDPSSRASEENYDAQGAALVGEVRGRDVIIVDDIVDSGHRVCRAARVCKAHGAKRVFAYAPHGVLRRSAFCAIEAAPLTEVLITNTLDLPLDADCVKIKTLNVSRLLALVLKRLHAEASAEGPREPLAELYRFESRETRQHAEQ